MKKSLIAFAATSAMTILPSMALAAEVIFKVEDRPRFHEFIVKQHHTPFRFKEEVRIGAVLPEAGVEFHVVPAEYHIRPEYRYAVVNDRVVIVEPGSRRIVEIVE